MRRNEIWFEAMVLAVVTAVAATLIVSLLCASKYMLTNAFAGPACRQEVRQ